MIIRDHRDAAAAAVESNARRAEPCAGCGMPKGSGLGPHYLGCPIDSRTVVSLFVDPTESTS